MSHSPPVTPRRFPFWRMGWLWMFSAGLGLCYWNRPFVPLWLDKNAGGLTNLIGVTDDGRVLYLASSTRLIVRDAATGNIIAEHALKQPCSTVISRLTEDGERAVLTLEKPQAGFYTVLTRDGKQPFPPISTRATGIHTLSFDGRYLVVSPSGQDDKKKYQIFDLVSGLLIWDCAEETVFSRDSPTAHSLNREGEQAILVVRSMTDGRELNRVEIPNVEGRRITGMMAQRSGRLLFSFESTTPKPSPASHSDVDTWSGRLAEGNLTEFSREPFNYQRQVNAGLIVLAMGDENLCGELQIRDLYKTSSGRIWLKYYEWANRFGLQQSYCTQQYCWQPVSPMTGWRTGPPIDFDIPLIAFSPNGRWLVIGGSQITVYSLSPRSHTPVTLAVILLPCGMAWLIRHWRRRTAGLKTGSMTLP